MANYFITRYFYPDESSANSLLLDLTHQLSKQKTEINVITSNNLSNSNIKLQKIEQLNNIKIIRLRSFNSKKTKIYTRLLDYISFLINASLFVLFNVKKEDLVVCLSDPPFLLVFIALICKIKNIKQINWIHDVYPEVAVAVGINIPFSNLLKKSRNWAINHSHKNIVISNEMEDYFLKQGVKKDLISIIPNWANKEELFPLKNIDNKQYYNYANKEDFIISYSGNMGVLHDFDILLKSIEFLQKDGNIKFLFFGSGNQKRGVEEFISSNNLKNIKILPFQDRKILNMTLNIPDIHLITLKKHVSPFAFPSKIHGITAVGKPLIFIGEKSCEMFKIVQRNELGFSVENHNLDELIEVIYLLQSNNVLRSKIAKNSREYFLSNFECSLSYNKWNSEILNS